MIRSLAVATLIFLFVPAASVHAQDPMGEAPSAPHLMNNREFALFLKRLDAGVLRWQTQLRTVDTKSLRFDPEDRIELERSYRSCVESVRNTREEIQKLSQKQTLKLDFLLLVDLNDLARSLDQLDRDLTDPLAGASIGATQKSISYQRNLSSIDASLTPELIEFRRHVLALATVVDSEVDASLEPADDLSEIPEAPK